MWSLCILLLMKTSVSVFGIVAYARMNHIRKRFIVINGSTKIEILPIDFLYIALDETRLLINLFYIKV